MVDEEVSPTREGVSRMSRDLIQMSTISLWFLLNHWSSQCRHRSCFASSGEYQIEACKVSPYILVVENIQDTVHLIENEADNRFDWL